MDPDRLEKLVAQVLEETRALRQETYAFRQETYEFRKEANEKFAAAAEERRELRRDIGLLQSAIVETARGLKEVRDDVKRVEAKLDETIADHASRLDKLEGAAE